MHFRLGLNVRHADEQLRGTLMLPHGTGKDVRIAVFAEGDKAREAEEAGADIVGSADLAKRIEEGFTDFDVAIATPDQMGNVGKLGRVLGPRGLMPNPKTGTVTFEVGKAVREAKAGKLEYRTDRGANVHVVDRQEELRRARPRRELRRGRGRDHPREAVGGEGPLHPAGHDHEHDGPGHPRRSGEDPGYPGRVGASHRRQFQRKYQSKPNRHRPLAAARQKPSAGGVRSRGVSHRLFSSPPSCGLDALEEVIR